MDATSRKMLRESTLNKLQVIIDDFKRLTQRADNHSLYSVGRSAELQLRGALAALKWRDVFFKRHLEDTALEDK